MLNWDQPHGTSVEFHIDGRIQLNGEGGILAYLRGNVLLNPHLTLRYEICDLPPATISRVTSAMPEIPAPTLPHPHTMKLGEFISHARLVGNRKTKDWLVNCFSRVDEKSAQSMIKKTKLPLLSRLASKLSTEEYQSLFQIIQNTELPPPSTKSVLSVGEDALS